MNYCHRYLCPLSSYRDAHKKCHRRGADSGCAHCVTKNILRDTGQQVQNPSHELVCDRSRPLDSVSCGHVRCSSIKTAGCAFSSHQKSTFNEFLPHHRVQDRTRRLPASNIHHQGTHPAIQATVGRPRGTIALDIFRHECGVCLTF
jgi:hypothetical protein